MTETKRGILLIGNNLDVFQPIEDYMQTKGTFIRYAATASEALDSITKTEYCLVILNHQMPGISSQEMLRIMRLTKHIPILTLSDPLPPNDKVELFQAGADAIIESPFNADICIAQAEALMQLHLNADAESQQRGEISFGTGLIIIPRFRQVLVNGKTLSLTRKEFDLLHCFARHPRQVFSREQLYSYVWGDSFASGGDETVRVHVQTLRKKLEAEGITFIHNVWGVGYKFVPPNE